FTRKDLNMKQLRKIAAVRPFETDRAAMQARARRRGGRLARRAAGVSLYALLAASTAAAQGVTSERLAAADDNPGDWLMDGRTYSAQRFSPLDLINERNVKDLGLAWYYDLETLRGVEATPLAIDGVLYNI